MVITNLKKFESVCKEMTPFCKRNVKKENARYIDNTFLVDKNLMCATNSKILAVRNMSDCIINEECFAFPIYIKPTKVVTSDGDRLIIENKKEKWFSNEKKFKNYLDWKKVIPTTKPTALQEYDFSDYNFSITKNNDNYPKVTFSKTKEVIFEYKDFYDTVATFGNFAVNDDIFENNYNNDMETVSFPLEQFEWILKISKKFILEQFESSAYSPRVFTTKDYKFIVSPMVV